MEFYDEFRYWIKEREAIRIQRELGQPKPWSEDPVFQTVYFCNVRREDDKTTKWIRENWQMVGTHEHLVAMALARFVNKPDTLAKLGYPHKWDEEYSKRFVEYMETAKKPWSGAYIVSTNGNPISKAVYIASVLDGINAMRDLDYGDLARAYTSLMTAQGIGSFMAGQILADLKNSPGHPLTTAPDWWTWCAHGPGSLRGMSWLTGWEKVSPIQFYQFMPTLVNILTEDPPIEGRLHAQDIQNCLCEFDKWCRVTNGTGRSKRKYNGT